MLILAIEQSTSLSSVALLDDMALVAEREWNNNNFRNQHLFRVLPGLLREASVEPAAVDIFAVALGPGSFSGLRIAVSAARSLALPGKKPVLGVSSAEALAWQIFREKKATPIAIVGDARRNRLWVALFSATDNQIKMLAPFSLITFEQLASVLRQSSSIASPDWDRIGEKLIGFVPQHSLLIREKRAPAAHTVAELAVRKFRSNPSAGNKPLVPFYMHPPVAAHPRHKRDP